MADGPRQQPFVIRDAVPAGRVVAIVVVDVAVIAVCSAIAWDGNVPAWEASILEFINGWPDWLEPLMWVLQQVGVILAPVIAGLVVVWFTRNWLHLVPFVAVLPLKFGIEKAIVKNLVERERPFVSVGDNIEVRGPAFEGLSFPSGHATTVFAMAVLLAAFLPRRWRPVPFIWAAVVGIARLYYGEHNVLDVVAGAAMGTAFATVLWFFFLNRFVDTDADAKGTGQ